MHFVNQIVFNVKFHFTNIGFFFIKKYDKD